MTALNKEKLLRQLSKRQRRRREQRPAPATPEVKPASQGQMNRMVNNYQDLLRNIEHFVVEVYRNDRSDEIDDRAVMEGFRRTLLGHRSDRSSAGRIVEAITEARFMRDRFAPVADELWHDAIRALMRSVKNNSDLDPGETSYLDFVSHFV